MEAAGWSETSVHAHQTARRHMPEGHHTDTWKNWLSGIQGRWKITLKQMFADIMDVFHRIGFVEKVSECGCTAVIRL